MEIPRAPVVCLLLLVAALFSLLSWPVGAAAPAFSSDLHRSAWDESDTWKFMPPRDQFTDKALLDLRWLNETRSGEHGFVRLSPSGDSFVDGRAKPLRFWAVGSEIYRRSPDEMDRHCRFLAKLGVNLVRLHVRVADTSEGAAMTDVDQQVIDGVFRFIVAAKHNGIYLIISPYYAHHRTPKSWKLAGYSESGARPWGAIFIDRRMQRAYKQWTRRLYTEVNPHTGLAIKEDPTVAILQILNEDSLFFWTAQQLPEALVIQLRERYAEWLAGHYSSVAAAFDAWGDASHPDDNPASSIAGLYDTYQLTRPHDQPLAKRVRDQVQFLAELQRSFYADMGRHLRVELGCRQLLNASNWRTANDDRLKALERWTYRALDIDAENEYYGSDYQHVGKNHEYRIDPGHFIVNESCLHKPLELTTNFVCGQGRPFIVTETSWKRPNLYQSEGPFLVSAYQSLGGVDAVCWFVANEPTWYTDPRRKFWPVGDSYALDKWTCSTPMLMGMFPAAALSYRRADLEEGPVVAHQSRTLHSVFEREPPRLDDHEVYGASRQTQELKLTHRADGRPSRVMFLLGKVTSSIVDQEDGDPDVTASAIDMAPYLSPDEGTVRCATGQICWNYEKGFCAIDSPKTQGVAGFLHSAGGSFSLSDVVIDSDNHYASISVVSLDDEPLGNSRNVLIQVGTAERLTGWQTRPDYTDVNGHTIQGRRIANTGKPPLRIANAHVHVTINNDSLTECNILDCAGYRRKTVGLQADNGKVRVDFPPDALYVVLRGSGHDGESSGN